jgi:hypothetical protein
MIASWFNRFLKSKSRPAARRRPARAQLCIEQLEAREVPAVFAFPASGQLVVGTTTPGTDTVTIDHQIINNQPSTVVNGVIFGDSSITNIHIQGGFARVNILATSKPLVADDNNFFEVGSVDTGPRTGTMRNILAPLSLGTANAVKLDDSGDPTGQNITLNVVNNVVQVTGMGGAPISVAVQEGPLNLDVLGAFEIFGGRGHNTFNVLDTPAAFLAFTNVTVTGIVTGTSGDTVNVRGTHSDDLFIEGQARDTVTIGNNGNLNNIQSPVNIIALNSANFTALVVDGSAASSAQNLTLSADGTIHGLAPQDITYDPAHLSSLDVKGGHGGTTGGNTFTVLDTAPNATTEVDTGTLGDQVIVDNTHGQLFLNSLGGPATVNIGNHGSLRGIQGAIHIFNTPSFSTVNIDESADLVNHAFQFRTSGSQGVIDGLGFVAPIFYNPGDIASITLTSGQGSEAFQVESTLGEFPLTINGRGSSDQFIVGFFFGSLDHINNPLTLNGGAGFDTLQVIDTNADTGHFYSDNHFSQITRDFGVVTINYSLMNSEQLFQSPLPPQPLQFVPDPFFPAATNLALTDSIRAGQRATLTGQLTDADPREVLSLTVDWGDGSPLAHSTPNRDPFRLTHRYDTPGIYKVRVTWTDSIGRSNFQGLTLTVQPARHGEDDGDRDSGDHDEAGRDALFALLGAEPRHHDRT